MYSEEFENLLKEYLTDGIITTKERQVLLKKAQQLGYDVDEVDLYIDAQQQKCDQAVETAAAKRKGRLCPYCGASIPLLIDTCPDCGKHIAPEASEDFTKLMDNMDEALTRLKKSATIKGKGVNQSIWNMRGARKEYNEACADYYGAKNDVLNCIRRMETLYSNNPKVKLLIEEGKKEIKSSKWKAINKQNITLFIVLILFWVVFPTILYYSCKSLIKDSQDNQSQTSEVYISPNNVNDMEEAEFIIGITQRINSGNLEDAKLLLSAREISSFTCDKYDPLFLKIIKAYISKGDFDQAEELALTFKKSIGSSWEDTSTYKYLKKTYEEKNKDFSILETDKNE